MSAEHADTKESAKMWYNRGRIYHYIGESKDAGCNALSTNAFEEAANSYMNCLKFDTKKSYDAEVKQRLGNASAQLINRGVADFTNKNYSGALTNFENSIRINKEAFGKTDTLAIFNAALAAEKAQNYTKAIDMYKNLIAIKYGGVKDGYKPYFFLSNIYKTQNDNTNYIATIQEGRKAFPDDKNLILEELNYYLANGKDKEALVNLDVAIQKDNQNATLYFAQGSVYDKLGDTEKAELGYKKALEIKPDYFDALYNLGALYYNNAVKMNDAANSITDNAKYQKEMARVDEEFKKSVPYLEKAEQVKTDDSATYKSLLATLQKLYLMTDQPAKANEMKERLKN
jgi:tetratricopeptide (TPR) repeat protein